MAATDKRRKLGFLSSREEIEAQDDATFVSEARASEISEISGRGKIRITGAVVSLVQSVPSEPPSLAVEISDGSGMAKVTWIGQRRITGIECGSRLIVEGMADTRRGRLSLINPRYTLVSADYEGRA